MERIVDLLINIVWSPVLVIGLLLTGILFTFMLRFFQVRYLREMIKLMVKGEKSERGISTFQSVALSLAGRVGTGNIVGVSTAIFIGGPGAIFWMWVTAILGAATAYIESVLGQLYKREEDGEFRGGPAYYMEYGIGGRFGKIFGVIFAVVTVIAMGLLMPGVQSNAIASSFHNAWGVPYWIVGLVLAILLGLIIFGGVKSISKVASTIVPFMALGYILMALIIIVINITEVPAMFATIFKAAFNMEATFGGIFGAMIEIGVKRGVYSNEAGQGSGPHAAAAAEVSHPAKQGFVQSFSVYVDTLFVCTATALIILLSGTYNTTDGTTLENGRPSMLYSDDIYIEMPGGDRDYSGTAMYVQAGVDKAFEGEDYVFDPTFAGIGSQFIAIALFFFAFTTILAYSYMGETNVSYLTRRMSSGKRKLLMNVLRVALILATFYGAVKSAELAWDLGDLGVGLMAWLNLIGIWLLFKPALRTYKDYTKQLKEKDSQYILYEPKEEDAKNAQFWLHDYPEYLEETGEIKKFR